MKTTEYPLLKDTVRIQKFDQYLWLIESFSSFRHIALPIEIHFLAMCDGTTNIHELYEHMQDFVPSGSDVKLAGSIVDTVLEKFRYALEYTDDANKKLLRYKPSDFLYAIDSPKTYPERLPAPIEAVFTLTNRCNMHCIYCFNSSGEKNRNELTTEEWLSLVREAATIGIKKIHVTGGEPFCHPGIVPILKEIKKHDIMIEVATNGLIQYSDEVIELLKGERVQFSFDSLSKDIFTKLTQSREYERVLQNIKKFIDFGINVATKSCITNLNYQNTRELYEFLSDIGVSSIGIASYTISPSGRGGDTLSLTEEQIATIRSDFKDVKPKEGTELILGLSTPFWHKKEDIYSCDAMFQTMIVLPEGDVTGCEIMIGIDEMTFGNVRKSSILDIWNGQKVSTFFERKKEPTDTKCQKCVFVSQCQTGCFAEKYYAKVPIYGRDIHCRL